ncbi:putative nuclease HARBI1 [Tanacetum coccineum]
MTIQEQVARFLHIVGNDFRNRFVSWSYRRSGSATGRHFHRVLGAIISLEDQYIRQPTGDIVQKEIREKQNFYPYFKDCLGANDGTHVRVKVPSKDAPRYRGRKGYPTVNALVACTFDLKFTYVLSGWEGTASDLRIIKDALTRNDKLLIPDGKFYLVEGGLPHRSTLIAPYRGVKYHLKEYSTRAPQNPRELFNLRHASLRNSIERAFGVLKKRFPIIRNRDKELEDEVIHEVLDATPHPPRDMDDREELRNLFANEMWSEYLLHPNNEINMSNQLSNVIL